MSPKIKSCRFSVVNIKDIIHTIIPHFDKYPLQSAKSIDYRFWSTSTYIINDGSHLIKDGLNIIINDGSHLIKEGLNIIVANKSIMN